MSIRGKGKTAFAHIQDAEGRIQIYVRRDAVGEIPYSIWNLLDIGDIIGVKGPVFVTHTGETTVQVTEFVVLCKSIRPLPVVKEQMVEGERRVYDDIRSNVELRYRHRSIDLIINPEVREVFRVSRSMSIAGLYIQDGRIIRNAPIRLLRDSVVVHEGRMASLKRFKDDVREVQSGYECGIGLENFNDIKHGDVVECYMLEEVAPTL